MLQLQKPCSATREATAAKNAHNAAKSSPSLRQSEKARTQQHSPSSAKNKQISNFIIIIIFLPNTTFQFIVATDRLCPLPPSGSLHRDTAVNIIKVANFVPSFRSSQDVTQGSNSHRLSELTMPSLYSSIISDMGLVA